MLQVACLTQIKYLDSDLGQKFPTKMCISCADRSSLLLPLSRAIEHPAVRAVTEAAQCPFKSASVVLPVPDGRAGGEQSELRSALRAPASCQACRCQKGRSQQGAGHPLLALVSVCGTGSTSCEQGQGNSV